MKQRFEYKFLEVSLFGKTSSAKAEEKVDELAKDGWRYADKLSYGKDMLTYTLIFERPHPEHQAYANNLADYIAEQ